jgi:hypothetical protein
VSKSASLSILLIARTLVGVRMYDDEDEPDDEDEDEDDEDEDDELDRTTVTDGPLDELRFWRELDGLWLWLFDVLLLLV